MPRNIEALTGGAMAPPGLASKKKKKKRKKYAGEVEVGQLFIRTTEVKPKHQITMYLGETAPKVIDGYAQWTLVSRKRRKALLEFSGKNPLAVEVPFVIDKWDQWVKDSTDETEDRNIGLLVEDQIRTLETLAGRTARGSNEPPKLLWFANAPHDTADHPGMLWVIESLEWGDSVRGGGGNRIRQWGTLVLREWVGDVFISSAAEIAREKAKDKGLSGGGTYKIRKGDTLKNIARQKLGDSRRWAEIWKLNKKKIRDPDKLKVGIEIRIPRI